MTSMIYQAVGDSRTIRSFISCLDKAVVYKAHTPKSYYAAIGKCVADQKLLRPDHFRSARISTPKMLEWYKQRVGWYKAVYE